MHIYQQKNTVRPDLQSLRPSHSPAALYGPDFHLVPPNSQNSTHGDFCNVHNLFEIVSFPLRYISGIVIHWIQDPTVSFKYLSRWESVGVERLVVRAAGCGAAYD